MAEIQMAQDILSGVQRRVAFALSLIDPNQTDPGSPVSQLNLRDSVRACLQIREYLTDGLRFALKSAAENRADDYNADGKMILAGFDVALKTIRAVGRALDAAVKEGRLGDMDAHFEEEVARFRETASTLEHDRAEFEARWPWFDEARLLESIAADRSGAPRKVAREAFREVRSRIQGAGH